jgi:hypothetical protein
MNVADAHSTLRSTEYRHDNVSDSSHRAELHPATAGFSGTLWDGSCRANRLLIGQNDVVQAAHDLLSIQLQTFTELSMKIQSARFFVRVGVVVVLLFVAIQFVPYGRNHVNPPVGPEPTWDSPETRALAKRACFDCHSNETEWPAYSKIAPVSWLIQHDVGEGRAVLNFSEWHRPQEEAKEAAEEVLEGEMPLRMYQLMHAHARLNARDRELLARGLERTLVKSRAAGERTER